MSKKKAKKFSLFSGSIKSGTNFSLVTINYTSTAKIKRENTITKKSKELISDLKKQKSEVPYHAKIPKTIKNSNLIRAISITFMVIVLLGIIGAIVTIIRQ